MSYKDSKPENNNISKGTEMQTSLKNNINMNNSDINVINKIGNSSNEDNANINSTKGKLSLRSKIIILVAIILAIALVVLLVVLLAKKKEKKKINFHETTTTNIFESQSIYLEESATTLNLEGEIIMMDYDEAEALIGSETVKEIHNFFNESSNNLDDLSILCNNLTFSRNNVSINSLPENLDELLNNMNESSNGSLEIFKSDLDLYHSKYMSFSKEVENLTEEFSATIKFLSKRFGELKIDLNNFTEHFEKTIQNISIPYSSNWNKSEKSLRILDTEENNIEEIFKEEDFKELKEIVGNIQTIVKNWVSLMKVVYNFLSYINEKSIAGISNFNELLEVVVGGAIKMTINELLMRMKDFLISTGKKVSDYYQILKDNIDEVIRIAEDLKTNFDLFKEENPKVLEKINNSIKKYSNKFKKDFPKIEPISEELFNSIHKAINFIVTIFTGIKSKIDDFTGIFNVEVSTSLDLLFIMDITGSMDSYINYVKNYLLDIIDGIVKECPGININIGYIGYRDYYEKYIDVDFSQDPNYVKGIISKVYAAGGGDYPEDVSLAFELALNKTWKNNAKLAVFIADAPEHGEKYGGTEYSSYLYKKPERRELDKMVEEMAEKGISLFCLRIRKETDIMYKIFEDIYNKKKANNTQFLIVDRKNISLSGVVINYAVKVYNEQRNSNDDCLISKKEAISILKTKYGINNYNPDENIRFLLGKCNPVLLVPGVYATKLVVQLNCKEIANKEKDTTLKDIRLFCSSTVCPNELEENEEHSLLISLLDEAFGIEGSRDYSYGSCLGLIATYYQNENECPKFNGKSICRHSKYIKVGYYGGTTNTLKNSRCGVEGVTNVIQTGDLLVDAVLNSVVGVSGSFNLISKNLIKRGYKEGFSLGAIPNDYRRYLYTNNFATKVFESQINRLYQNTGKPVVIIAHSYGTLLTLTNLLKKKDDNSFLKKIKKFVAMAPPFGGATKLLDVFLHGTDDFNKIFETHLYDWNIKLYLVHYSLFGQYLMYKALPTIMELRPQSIAAKIFTDSSYNDLGNAIKDRLEIERICKNKNCNISEVEKKTSSFDKIFKGYFPSFLDPECAFESKISGNQNTFNRKCFTNIYNVGDCPTIIPKSATPDKTKFENDIFCNNYGKNFFYQGQCSNKKSCLDELYYSDKCPNVYSDTKAVNYLIARFNNDLINVARYGFLDQNYFENYEDIKSKFKTLLEYQNSISIIKDLPVPPIDTDLVYGSFYPTTTSLVLDDDDFIKPQNETLKKGGDETVPTWSSLLTGLKWIYDIKNKKLTQKVKLIEYCSRLAKAGQYKHDPTKNQNFSAISCRCLDDNNFYKSDKELKQCSHASMLQDKNLFNYIFSIVNEQNKEIDVTDSKKEAINKYNIKTDYNEICNKEIYDILDDDGPINIDITSYSSKPILKSSCKIEFTLEKQKKEGKGILLSISMNESDTRIRGIITTNYVIDTNKLYNNKITLICGEDEKKIEIIPKEHFCFSDSFLDITYIELKNNEFDKFVFLKYDETDLNSNSIYVINNLKEKKLSVGTISDKYGFKINHNILLNNDYIGSPLVSSNNNNVIGICTQKKTQNNKNEISYVAIDIKSIIKGIKILFDDFSNDKTAFIKKENGYILKELKILNDKDIQELKEHGLISSSIPELFISPKTISITQLWFFRTNYAWYWTPVEPKNNDFEISNWHIICSGCSLKVIGSNWNGDEPAEKNINLINWLASTGLNYLV